VADGILRKLFVLLGVKGGEQSARDLKRLQTRTNELKASFGGLVRDLGKVGLAMSAAATAGLVQARATAREAEAIDRRSRALQLSRREYQRHLRVFEQFGADGSDIADALGTITDRAEDAMDGMKNYIEDFGLVGVAVSDLRGKNPAELFATFADAVATSENRNAALTATVRILGDDLGAKLMPMLLEGSAGMAAMGDEAERLGAVMSDDALDASLSMQRSWRELGLVVTGLRNELGVALAPVVEDVVTSIRDWATANGHLIRSGLTTWVERLEGPVTAVKQVFLAVDRFVQRVIGYDSLLKGLVAGGGLAGVLYIGTRVWQVLRAGRAAWLAASVAASGFGVSLGPVVTIIGLVVAAVGSLALFLNDFWVTMQGGDSLMLRFIERWQESEGFLGAVARLLRVSMRNARALLTILTEGGDDLSSWAMSFGPVQKAVEKLERAFGRVKSIIAGALELAEAFVTKGIFDKVGGMLDALTRVFEGGITTRLEAHAAAVSAPALPPIGGQFAADRAGSSTTVHDNRSTTTVDNRPTVNLYGNTAANERLARDLAHADSVTRGGPR